MPSLMLLEPPGSLVPWRGKSTAATCVGTGGTGLVTRDKEGYSLMIKESMRQDDIKIVCVCIYIYIM